MSQVPPNGPNDPNQPQQPQQPQPPQQAVPAQPVQPAAPVPPQPVQAQPVQPAQAQPVQPPQPGGPYQGPGVVQTGQYHVPAPTASQGRSDGALILGILSIVMGSIALLLSNIPCLDFLTGGTFTSFVLISIALGAAGILMGIKANGGWIVPVIGVVISAVAWINQWRLNDRIDEGINEMGGDATEFREKLEELGEELESSQNPF